MPFNENFFLTPPIIDTAITQQKLKKFFHKKIKAFFSNFPRHIKFVDATFNAYLTFLSYTKAR